MNKIYTIYKISNIKDQRSYIGFTSKTIKRRFQEHLYLMKYNSNSHLHNALRFHGVENFTIEEIYQSLDFEHCVKIMEPFFIKEYNSYNDGYNMTLGGDGGSFIPNITNKIKLSCMKKYGVDNPMKSREIKRKLKNTMLKRHGVEHASQKEEFKIKAKQTCVEKYGVDSHNKSDLVKKKKEQTFIKKYGVDNPSKSNEIKKNRTKCFQEKYGVENPSRIHFNQEQRKFAFDPLFYYQTYHVKEKMPYCKIDELFGFRKGYVYELFTSNKFSNLMKGKRCISIQ